jgi:hypothetical protein
MNKASTFLSRLRGRAARSDRECRGSVRGQRRAVAQIATVRADRNLTSAAQIEKLLMAGPLGRLAQIRDDVTKRMADATNQRSTLASACSARTIFRRI